MANRDDYKFIFTQKNTTKPTIQIGDRTFKINNRSMIMRLVNEEYRNYLKATKIIKKYADSIAESQEDENKMLEVSEEIITQQTIMSDVADKIIILLIGEEGNDYVDNELGLTFEDKQELSNTLYSLASGQEISNKEESAEDTSFRAE